MYPSSANPSRSTFGSAAWSHTEPFLSSASRAWRGIAVELFRARDVDFAAQYPGHVVSLLLRGPINLFQRRNGHAQQRVMHAGDIIVTPLGEPKLLRHTEETEILKLRIEPAFLQHIVDEINSGARRHVELLDNFGTRDPYIESVACALLAEVKTEGFASQIYVESLTNQLVVHLLRHYSSVRSAPEGRTSRLPRYKLERATEYIDENLRTHLSLEEISRTISMSPYHFAHVFALTVGLTPHRYVTQRRMERAKSLLRETTLPVTQIAHQVGYSNQSHFSMVFRRFTGQTPRGYRRDS